jgi:hypothetical protein
MALIDCSYHIQLAFTSSVERFSSYPSLDEIKKSMLRLLPQVNLQLVSSLPF